MERRKFLQGLAPAAAAGALAFTPALTTASGDEFVYRNCRIKWCGWREPVNQNLTLGFWWADNPRKNERPFVYSTTLGIVSDANEADALNFTRADRSIPFLTCFSTPEAHDAEKDRAKTALLKFIDSHS